MRCAMTMIMILLVSSLIACDAAESFSSVDSAQNNFLKKMYAHPPLRVMPKATATPTGFTPAQIKKAYNLPDTGGSGTIAVIVAYDAPTIEDDLNVFSAQFGLPSCTTDNGCFEKHTLGPTALDNGWLLEITLDVEWAHAIAPEAKILLVEAKTNNYPDLFAAIKYAAAQSDVVAVSMSWGSSEWPYEINYDHLFTSDYDMVFFAASGDSGHGTYWPAASARVVAVGGTELTLADDGTVLDETAWLGSSGGLSDFYTMPADQLAYGVPNFQRRRYGDHTEVVIPGPRPRAVPDVAYHASLSHGYAIYLTGTYGWHEVGGTSAGCPQWAAIHALGHSATRQNLYRRAASPDYEKYFRDITSGSNGFCGAYCNTRPKFDYVTGLGSPLTIDFN